MRSKTILKGIEKIELARTSKNGEKENQDCRIFKKKRTREIIEETWSTRK